MNVRNLLLIENDDQHAEQVRHLLTSAEGIEAQQEVFEIHRSTSLTSSLAVLEDRPIDVILLDDALLDRSGIESINEIQANGCSVPIILYTDISDNELALQAVRAGAQNYLIKEHVTSNELVHCLLHAIERQQRIATEATLGDVREQQSRMGALQAHLLPHQAPRLDGYEIAGRSEPAATAGGDYFDYLQLPEGHLGIAIADVSGHELASSLTMAGLRRCVRTCARLAQPIDQIMMQANVSVCEDALQGHFVVAMLAEIDPVQNTLRFVTAGHRGYLITPANEVLDLDTPAIPLGLQAGQDFCTSEPIKLDSGSVFVALTDGIWEAMSPTRQQWGLDTVLSRIRANRRGTAEEIVEQLFNELHDHCAPNDHDDDAALVVVKKL